MGGSDTPVAVAGVDACASAFWVEHRIGRMLPNRALQFGRTRRSLRSLSRSALNASIVGQTARR